MEEELRQLVAQAVARGATQDEIKRIVLEYNASKKKEGAFPSASPVESAASTDSSFASNQASTPGIGSSDSFRVSSIDDVYDQPVELNGYTLTGDEEVAVRGYVDKYDQSYTDYLYENFDPYQYLDSYGSKGPEGADVNQLREDILSDLGDTYGGLQSEEALPELLRGLDSEFSGYVKNLRGTAESLAMSPTAAGPLATAIEVGRTRVDEGFRQGKVDLTYENLFDEAKKEAEIRFRNATTKNISEDVLQVLPEELRDDRAARNQLERSIYRKYHIPLDLNGDGYVNKDDDRTWMSESADGLLAAGFETLAGLSLMTEGAMVHVGEALGFDMSNQSAMLEFKDMMADEISQDLRKDMRIPLSTMSEKFDSGDIQGGVSDGLAALGESIPMMTAAIASGMITKNSKVSAGVVSLMGSGTSYFNARNEEWFEELGTMGKMGFVAADGIAEGLPALVGANIINRFRAFGAGANLGRAEYIVGLTSRLGLGIVEEGVTEAVTAGIQYADRVAAGAEEWDDDKFVRSVKDGWYGGVVMGGAIGGTGASLSLTGKGASLAMTSIGSLRSRLQVSELQKQYDLERDPERKAALGKRIVDAIQGAEEQRAQRRAFYDWLSETSPEAFQRLLDIQTKIGELSIAHTRETDGKKRGQLKKQIAKLVQERAAAEAEYDFDFDSDARAERDSILKRVAEVDEQFSGYGEIFEGDKDSVEVTGENADSVLDRILSTTLEKINLDLGKGIGVISSIPQIKKGLTNAVRVAKALQKIGVTQGIVIHKTLKSMQDATEGRAARGMAFADGRIHLLLPALRANTAYHEGFHTFVVQELGQNASRRLAAALVRGMSTELVEKYRARLQQDMGTAIPDLKSAVRRGDFKFADELLMELLADVTEGTLSVDVKKGLLRNFAQMLAPVLSTIGVRDIATPKIQDLADAITAMTGQLAKGEAPNAAAVREAMPDRLGVSGVTRRNEEEREVKPQELLAPNGQPSNLNAEQHARVRTEEFKQWFGDWENDPENASKVVDENGEPAVMFHGTPVEGELEGNKFDLERHGSNARNQNNFRGVYFGRARSTAERYLDLEKKGRVIEAFVDIKNPWTDYYTNYVPTEEDVAWFEATFAEYKENNPRYFEEKLTEFKRRGDTSLLMGWAKVELARLKGFDGVFDGQFAKGQDGYSDNVTIAFDPDAVVPADGVKFQGKLGATLQFITQDGRKWSMRKVFNGEKHVDNFINYMERKGYTFDEIYYDKTDPKFQGTFEFDETLSQRRDVDQVISELGLTREQLDAHFKKIKLPKDQRQKPIAAVSEFVDKLVKGEVTQEQFIKFVREEMPITPFTVEKMPAYPSVLDIAAALYGQGDNVMNQGIVGVNKQIPDGYWVGLRLDIPSYNKTDVWTVSIHQGSKNNNKTPNIAGSKIGFAQTGRIVNGVFNTVPKVAADIGRGFMVKRSGEVKSMGKSTIARMFGEWVNHDPDQLRQEAIDIMNGDQYNIDLQELGPQQGWIQVGMNPYRHSWFYDKRDGRPIDSFSDLIQIGPLVLAKDTVKIDPSDSRFSFKGDRDNEVKYQGNLVSDTKEKTVQGVRIGQGRASRVIKGERVVEPGSFDGTLDVSISGLREKDQEAYIANAAYLAQMDMVRAVKKFQARVFSGKNALAAADEVYKIFVDEVADNLVFLHDQFNEELRDIATLWYDGANIISQELATRYDMSVEQVSAVIAALSPQKDWYQNLRLAELVIDFMKTVGPDLIITQDLVDFHKEGGKKWAKDLQQYVGQPFSSITKGSDAAAILWAYADLNMGKEYHIVSPDGKRGELATKQDGSPKKAAWGSRSMIAAAMDAVSAVGSMAFSEILGNQHKIRNFFNNIANPGHGSDATIDTHAVAAAHLKPFAGSSAEVIINLGGSKVFVGKDGAMYSLEQVKKMAKTSSAPKANAYAAKKGMKVVNVKSKQGLGLSGMYYAYLDAYRKAAEARGVLPREMQSITWEAVRLLYTASFKQSSQNKSDIEALHRKYTNGELTKEQLRAELLKRADGIGNPDWADVFAGVEGARTVESDAGRISGEGRTDGGEGTGTRGDSVVRGQVRPVQSDGTSTGDAKFQGDLTKLVADFLDKEVPSPKVRGKKNIKLEEVTGGTLDAFVRKKKDIIDLLLKMGYDKQTAEAVYQNAKAFKTGRVQGRRAAMKVARKAQQEANKRSTEANKLKKDLEKLKDKAKTVNEFFSEAIKLVAERMKGKGQQPFSRKQIERLFRISRMAHKVSAKKAQEQGLDAMQTFIDKLTEIFDQQDAKEAMQQYLRKIEGARKLQQRLKKMSKIRRKGESLKGTATYRRVAQGLSEINPALIPAAELDNFIATLAGTYQSMSKAFAQPAEEGGYEGVAPLKVKVEDLTALLSNFKAMEELGRDAAMVARAMNAAKRNKTSFEEEYDKLKLKYERSQTSSTVNKIRDFIEEHNSNNPTNQLDPANPADVQYVLDQLSQGKADVAEEKKQAIINDVIIPRVAGNLMKLMEDKHIREILGFYNEGDFDAEALRSRLSQLSAVEVINIDYKLDDYIVNDSVFGLGYVAALVRGKIDYAKGMSRLQRRLGLKAKNTVFLKSLQTIDSMLRQLFPIDNISMAKLRRYMGFGAMEGAFAEADAMHARVMEQFEAKIKELGVKDVATVKAKAIAQIFSMSRQIPQGKDATPEEIAMWFNALKDIMLRSIEDKAQQPNVIESDIQQLREAYTELFENNDTLEGMQASVEANNPKIVELVDFTVQMHEYLLPLFKNYVERFLGKELIMEDNYTAFDVRTANEDVEVEHMLQLRRGMLEALKSSSLSNAKKVAGGSFERNPRAITGKDNTIGLDFLAVNERRIRENIILSKTVGHVASMRFVFKSKAMSDLIPQKNHRKDLEIKMMGYIQQDTGTVPLMFRPNISIFGYRTSNPMSLLRAAVIVKAFGSVYEQTLKQGGVVLSAMAQFKNPLQAVPYMMQTIAEMVYFSIKTGFGTDSKIVLDKDGRYRLLENSPVFSRDYEAGNIDPFTGSMRFDQGRLADMKKVLTDIALKNLKGTDKVAAVATWFAYYADYLVATGQIQSIGDINWDDQAENPNVEALSYADSMLTKDQAASTPRQAADAFRDVGDAKGNVVRMLRTFVLPFARFAINKKMSILGDVRKLGGDATSKKEAASAMVGHTAELAMFHYISQILLPWTASILVPDEEEEVISDRKKRASWGRVLTGVVNDFLPIPPFPVVDDYINHFFMKYVVFGMAYDGMWDESYSAKKGQTYDEQYENFLKVEGYTPVFKSEFDPQKDPVGILRILGPVGDYVLETKNLLENVMEDGNKVISPSGREYFVRPEDKQDIEISQLGRVLIAASAMAGFSSKELERVMKRMDDLPAQRSFNSEEELAMYEILVEGLQKDDHFAEVAQLLDEDGGTERLRVLLKEHIANNNILDAKASVARAKASVKGHVGEYALRKTNPDLYRKYIRELRALDANATKEDLAVLLKNKKESLTKEDYRDYETAVIIYMGIGSENKLRNAYLLNALYELEVE